jgi:hypothetical protein
MGIPKHKEIVALVLIAFVPQQKYHNCRIFNDNVRPHTNVPTDNAITNIRETELPYPPHLHISPVVIRFLTHVALGMGALCVHNL